MKESVAAVAVLLAALAAGCAAGTASGPAAVRGEAPARSTKVLFSNAEGHFFKGNTLQAIDGYAEVIAADPKNAPAFRCRAAAFAVLGRDAEALADYGRAVALDPRLDEAWLGRGLFHFARGRYAEAIDDLDQTAALDPDSATVHKYRALACERVGRLRDAAVSRHAYIHCEVPHEHPEVQAERPPIRELKAFGLE